MSFYRPEIDGLRAIAVLAVIGYHLFPTVVPGGFIGVDVFFVISGFLIFSQIFTELKDGTFQFKSFYSRRMRRLLPLFVCVSLVVSLVALIFLIPNDLNYFSASLLAAWSFASNFFFSMLSGGYFEPRKETFPFLHTWSLSVEEQFYFFFPLLLWLSYRMKRIGVALGLFFGITLLYSILIEHGANFYFSSIPRMNELLMGALTAWIASKVQFRARILTVLGLFIIAGSIFLFNAKVDFPGVNAMIPCLGAALLLWPSSTGGLVGETLSSGPMRFLGRISYSLYLWHWPAIAFFKSVGMSLGTFGNVTFIVGLGIVSTLSYSYIEMPFRKTRWDIRRSLLLLWLCPFGLAAIMFSVSYFSKGMLFRYSSNVQTLLGSYSGAHDLTRVCTAGRTTAPIQMKDIERNCALGTPSATGVDFLLLGDSHANHFKPALEELAVNAQKRGYYLVLGSCNLSTDPKSAECERFWDQVKTLVLTLNPRLVVLGGAWTESAQALDKIPRWIESIKRPDLKWVIFKRIPTSTEDLSRCPLNVALGREHSEVRCTFPRTQASTRSKISDQFIEGLTVNPKVEIVDPKEFFCDDQNCKTEIGNLAVFQDHDHLNESISRRYARYLIEKGKNFLSP